MASELHDDLVGVSISGQTIKLVEVEFLGGQYQVKKIVEKDANLSFDFHSAINEGDSAKKAVADLINNAISSSKITARNAAFTLDSQVVLVKKIPIDADLPGHEIKNQVQWEAEQFVFQPLDQYIIDYNHLRAVNRQDQDELLVVMVKRAIIDFLMDVFKRTPLHLQIVDVDVFAAIRAIKANYEYKPEDKIGLIDIGWEGLKITLMTRGDYFLSTGFSFVGEQNGKKVLSIPDDEQLGKLISKELRRIILDHKIGKYIEDLDRIFFYGELVKPSIVENLQNFYDVRINKINPFRKVRFTSVDVGDESIRNAPEKFVVCIGTALRNV
jgi:Tfp pilus assembly PilM family ATPase